MKPNKLSLIVAVFLALAAVPARASWLIAEVDAGVAVPSGLRDDALGSAVRATFGGGGRLGGSPFRLYALVSIGHAWFGSDVSGGPFTSSIDRNLVDLGLGGRILAHLGGGVRIYADVLGGYGFLMSDVVANGVEELSLSTGGFGMTLGGGLQVRLFQELSVGLRGEWSAVFVEDAADAGSVAAGLPSPARWEPRGRTAALATFTFHF